MRIIFLGRLPHTGQWGWGRAPPTCLQPCFLVSGSCLVPGDAAGCRPAPPAQEGATVVVYAICECKAAGAVFEQHPNNVPDGRIFYLVSFTSSSSQEKWISEAWSTQSCSESGQSTRGSMLKKASQQMINMSHLTWGPFCGKT